MSKRLAARALAAGAVALAIAVGGASAAHAQHATDYGSEVAIGRWAPTAAQCASPPLVIFQVEDYVIRFRFTAPVKRELKMDEVPPPPQVVGVNYPETFAFRPVGQREPVGTDIQLEMPNRNTLDFIDEKHKKTRYVRCAERGVG